MNKEEIKSINVIFIDVTGKEIVKYEVDKGNADLKKLLPRLEERASEMGFTIVDKDQTGNCMFYSLSDQLELVEKRNISPKKLRHSLVDYLREKRVSGKSY